MFSTIVGSHGDNTRTGCCFRWNEEWIHDKRVMFVGCFNGLIIEGLDHDKFVLFFFVLWFFLGERL